MLPQCHILKGIASYLNHQAEDHVRRNGFFIPVVGETGAQGKAQHPQRRKKL
jgi:hypothetical protein